MGGAQLLVGVRGGRHARAAARLRPRRPRGAALHVRALERQRLSRPTRRARRSRSRCASCTSATTWRRSAACSRRSTPSRPPATAATARTTRRSPTCSSRTGASGSSGSRETEPWDAVLALEPEPHRMLAGDELDDALTVAADFIDLKSPYMGGHSRRCAQLAADAARVLGLADEAVTALRRAALVHDFGTTVVPNSIWDKPGPLTRTEFDRVELHPMLTEQMLRRSPALAALNPVASRAPREVRRLRLPQARARRRRRPRSVRARGDGGLRRADHRARRPPAVLAPTTRPPSFAGSSRTACSSRARAAPCSWPRGTASRAARRASGRTTRAGCPVARSTCCGSRRKGLTTREIADRLVHLAQDRRPPHPAHLRQDRRVDASRGGAVGDAARRRPVSLILRVT